MCLKLSYVVLASFSVPGYHFHKICLKNQLKSSLICYFDFEHLFEISRSSFFINLHLTLGAFEPLFHLIEFYELHLVLSPFLSVSSCNSFFLEEKRVER